MGAENTLALDTIVSPNSGGAAEKTTALRARVRSEKANKHTGGRGGIFDLSTSIISFQHADLSLVTSPRIKEMRKLQTILSHRGMSNKQLKQIDNMVQVQIAYDRFDSSIRAAAKRKHQFAEQRIRERERLQVRIRERDRRRSMGLSHENRRSVQMMRRAKLRANMKRFRGGLHVGGKLRR